LWPVPRRTAEEEIARRYHIPIPPQLDLPISYNIAPIQNVLAIRPHTETGERTLDALRWGLIPSWAKDEKSHARPSMRGLKQSMPHRRTGRLSRNAGA